jgi:electron transport complex protein RnfD
MSDQFSRLLSQRPQINLARPTMGRMAIVGICAALGILQSSLTDSFASLGIAVAAVGAAVLTEFVINRMTDTRTLRDGSAVASALVFTLLLPNQISPLFAVLGAVFAIAVVKQSFGGLGANWMNPALGGWLFVRFSWPDAFEKALAYTPVPPEAGSIAMVFQSFFVSLDGNITEFLNNTIFRLTGSELPGGYIDLLFSFFPGIIADRGCMALLLGALLITSAQVSRFWIAPLFLGVYALLIRIFGAFPGFRGEAVIGPLAETAVPGYGLGNGDMLYGLFSGGIITAAFLLALEPVSGAKTGRGAVVIAVLGGVFSFLFRYQGGEPFGAFFALALLNALTPLIRSVEDRVFLDPRLTETRGPL